MNGVNLIPESRRRARARRGQVRVWSAVMAICVLCLAGAYAGLWSAWRTGGDDPAADADKVAKELADAERLDKAKAAQVSEAKAREDAAREVLDQPDWGALLTFVAGKLGPEAALDSVRVEPPSKAEPAAAGHNPAPKAGSPPASRRGACTLVLTGIAKSQDAASNVAIDLKATALFADVNLVETRRTGFNGEPAVEFRIDCAIVGAGGTQ